MLRSVRATQYVTPLREGGSLPAIIEADDLGLYVVKFRGAGQGPLALAAELIAGRIGQALDLPVPEIVFVEVDAALGRNEPDQEIRDLLKASNGRNLGLDYLPGSTMFDPAARDKVDGELASLVVWFDAFVSNVDRTARNTNMLTWHQSLYLIDHGAALYWHHDWRNVNVASESTFPVIRDHVLLPWATDLYRADIAAREHLHPDIFTGILEDVPDDWLLPVEGADTPDAKRSAYVSFLTRRLAASSHFVQEAIRARTQLL